MKLFKRQLGSRAEANSEPSQTTKMGLFKKIIRRLKNINYFCSNIHFRFLSTPLKSSCSGNTQKSYLR